MQNLQRRAILDSSQLQQIMQTVELACNSIQMHVNPNAAEAALLDLCQSSNVYQACKFILENSQVANAKFQAAAAIRKTAIKEWGSLYASEKLYLINFCLCFVMRHGPSSFGYVQTKVSSTAAHLIKRGWLEFTVEQKKIFFSLVEQAIFGVHGVDVQYYGINFLECLVSEFSPTTLSEMGLPGEYHEKCKMSLELEHLKTFYCWAQKAARSVANKIVSSDSDVSEAKICTSSCRLMFQILNWNFKKSAAHSSETRFSASSEADNHVGDSFGRTECVLVQPGPAWRDVLLLSDHIQWILSFYGSLRRKFYSERSWLDCPVAVYSRKLIVQLCSLTGTIFSSDGHMQEHLKHLLSGIIQWIDPPDDVCDAVRSGKSGSELLDGCHALFSIATVVTPSVFNKILKPIRPFGTFYLLATLMGEVVKEFIVADYIDDESWSWVARDILLDTWDIILVALDGPGSESCLLSEGLHALSGLFALIVQAELRSATASMWNDSTHFGCFQASVSAMDERLNGYALIGRAAVETTIPFITQLLSERFSRLSQDHRMLDSAETLEELYSLLLIAGHVLADDGEGETPLVPEKIQTAFSNVQQSEQHPVLLLSRSILSFSEQSLNPLTRESIFSPRLMEAVVWFLGRWSSTYLMQSAENSISNDHLKSDGWNLVRPMQSDVLNFYAENVNGKLVLDKIVHIANVTLLSYPGENDLLKLVCSHLLHAIVGRRVTCTHLFALDSWQSLAKAFVHEKVMINMHPSLQRSLAQVIVVSASRLEELESSNLFVRDFTCHMIAYLTELSNRKDVKAVAQQPNVIFLVTCMFERLRGVATGSEACTQKAVFEMGTSVLNSSLIFLDIYKHETVAVCAILNFVVHWLESQLCYLGARKTAVMLDFSMRLLQLYSIQNIGKICVSSSNKLLNEVKSGEYKELRVTMKLLTKLCYKGFMDSSLSPLEEYQGINIAEVVYFGLYTLAQLMSLEMLKYPKLCYDYFVLLSRLLEVYPEMILRLDEHLFRHVCGSIDFGIRHHDVEIVDMCLKALNRLASYHHKQTAVGQLGLGSRATGFQNADGGLQDGILSKNLSSLLQILLFEDYSTEIISSAADALLPLIVCNPALFQKLGSELIERQSSETLRTRAVNALYLLTTSNQLTSNLDRANYKIFRKNLSAFLTEVRGFLRTI